ncbi:MAG: hypothetical protein KDK44_06145, partial [Chlamydiia bacterium]|nr:hypothetical protein [Chlamydiia bacterium]
MKKIAFALLVSTVVLFAETKAPEPAKLSKHLQVRAPEWRAEMLASYPNGNPQEIVFHGPDMDGKEMPQKRIRFFDNGRPYDEVDLSVVEEGSEAYELHKSTIVPHGLSVQ